MSAPRRVYLDYNATAPLRTCARDAMRAAMEHDLGNPSSPHVEGRRARGLLDDARHQVAALVGAAPDELVFTSGGTEAVNAMIAGVASESGPGARVRSIYTQTDHACVHEAIRRLGAGCGVGIAVDSAGRIDLARLDRALADGATCAVTHWANNETGVVQDVAAIGAVCRARGVPFLVDAVQAAGKLPIDFHACPAQALALSAHKLGGPQGVGALVLDARLPWTPLLWGGHQEHDRRGGTESVLAAIGFGAAAAAAAAEQDYAARVAPLRDRLHAELVAAVPTMVVHGADAPRVANTLNVRVPGWAGETLVQRLDLEGIAAGTGAACAAGAAEPSHVLLAMGLDGVQAAEAVRFSLGFATTETETTAVVNVMRGLAAEWGCA